jgi:hypothetical protein
MASGDVTISVAVEGGVTKTVTLASATREKAKLATTSEDCDLGADAAWQVFEVNKLASVILAQANQQLEAEVSWTPASFTAAT